MRMNEGDNVYFLKGVFDRNNRSNIVRKEGTFYVEGTVPSEYNDRVIKGTITRRSGEISEPYYNLFMTFSKKDMWGEEYSSINRSKNDRDVIAMQTMSGSRNKLTLDTMEQAREVYFLLQKRNVKCTLVGKVIDQIDKPTLAGIILKEYLNGDNRDDSEDCEYNNYLGKEVRNFLDDKEESNSDIII